MFSMLLESRHAAETPTLGSVLSAGAHVLLLSAALAVPRSPPRVALASERVSVYALLDLSAKPERDEGARDRAREASAATRRITSQEPRWRALLPPTVHVDASGMVLPVIALDIDYMARAADVGELQRTGGFVGTAGHGHASAAAHPGGVYLAHEVDKVAMALPDNPRPAYPESLRRTRRQGRVAVEFVVDTLGRADTTSFLVHDSAHPMFTLAVRDVLPYLRFLPAESGGHKVPMRVLQPFSFVIR